MERQKIIIDINKELHGRFKTIIKAHGYTFTEVLENFIAQYVKGKITVDKDIKRK